MEELIKAVREHALKNYETSGWDYVIECWEDKDILEAVQEAGAKSKRAAIKAVGSTVEAMDDQRQDAVAAGGGDGRD